MQKHNTKADTDETAQMGVIRDKGPNKVGMEEGGRDCNCNDATDVMGWGQ